MSKEDYVFGACQSFQIAQGIISFTVLRCKFEEIDAFVKSKNICPPLIKPLVRTDCCKKPVIRNSKKTSQCWRFVKRSQANFMAYEAYRL